MKRLQRRLLVRQEKDLAALIALIDEISQTFAGVDAKIADNRNFELIIHIAIR